MLYLILCCLFDCVYFILFILSFNSILDTSNKHSPFTKIPEQQARIDTLRVIAEKVEDETKINQLNDLDNYLEGMKKDFEQAS